MAQLSISSQAQSSVYIANPCPKRPKCPITFINCICISYYTNIDVPSVPHTCEVNPEK
jgi:ribosomal protein RSM22 (predicted rRNA methylase)